MFAILGKELFAFKLSFVDRDMPVLDDYDFVLHTWKLGNSPDFNFDNFLQSLTSVFIYFAVDGWNSILQDALRMPGLNPFVTICYCFTLYIVGNLVIY